MADSISRYAYPKYKVFIYGVDVTADVVSINTQSHDGEAPNQCHITLTNELDRYIVTTSDLLTLKGINAQYLDIPWMTTDGEVVDINDDGDQTPDYAEGYQGVSVEDLSDESLEKIYDFKKKEILLRKRSSVQRLVNESYETLREDINLGAKAFNNYYGDPILRYPLADGAPIFHVMDPVRVFMRDPFDPNRWYYHFTGFISDMVDNYGNNNNKQLTIAVEDPTKLFRYTRIAINPGAADANKVVNDNDLRVVSFYANYMHDFNIAEVFFSVIFGPERIQVTKILEEMKAANGKSKISTNLRGIGHFSFESSGIFTYGPPPQDDFDEYEPPAPPPQPAAEAAPDEEQEINSKNIINADKIKEFASKAMYDFLLDLNENGITYNKKPHKLRINSGFRTEAEQQKQYEKGRAFVNGKWEIVSSGAVVTDAPGGAYKSRHEYAAAVDLQILASDGKDIPTSGNAEIYQVLGDAAEAVGLTWGGRFKKRVEPWHIEDKNFTVAQYKKWKADKEKVSDANAPPPAQVAQQAAQATATAEAKKQKPASRLFDFKPALDLDSLEEWQLFVDHEVKPADIITMARSPDGDTMETDSISILRNTRSANIFASGGIEAVVDHIGAHPEIYMVDGGRLLMLIPNSLGAQNSNVLVKDVIQSYGLKTDWINVGKILFNVVDRIQFSMYATPRGDIVVEPPLFDFDPDDFGMKPITSNRYMEMLDKLAQRPSPTSNDSTVSLSENNPATILADAENQFTLKLLNATSNDFYKLKINTPRGPYGPNYVIRKRDTVDVEAAFVDEKVHNIATAGHELVQNWEIGNTDMFGQVVVVKIPHLIPLYGPRQLTLTPRGFVASPEAAILYSHIQLNKANADAHTLKVNVIPNIKIGVNRPLFIQARNCLSTTKRVSQTITWGAAGEMGTSVDLYATRIWQGTVDRGINNIPIYTTIGGVASRPINFKILMSTRKPRIAKKEDTSDDEHE